MPTLKVQELTARLKVTMFTSIPTGGAGGDLSGSYPNPRAVALTETSGPDRLPFGSITDGQVLQRSGSSIVGADLNVGFGNDYQTAVSETRSTTTSSTFQNKVQLITPALTGTYRVGWGAIVDNADDAGEFRLQNVTDAATLDGPAVGTFAEALDRSPVGGFREVVFTGSAKTFEIQFRDQVGGNTQGIQQARIEVWKVS